MELPKGQKRKVKGKGFLFQRQHSIAHPVIEFRFFPPVLERLKTYVKDAYGCDLLDKLLTMDPSKRVDADAALNHDFFWTDPMPCDLSKMLGQHGQSMFEFLAPPRRAGRPAHPAMQAQPKPNPSADSSYQDRVFWWRVRLLLFPFFPFISIREENTDTL